MSTQNKTKMEKINYKIMEKDYVSLGKTQKREKPTSKSRTNTGKIGKQKNGCRCVRECRFGGLFFILLERKERVSVAVAVVGLESLRVSFLFCRLVRSIHPVDVWTKDESFFHPPSSTAGIFPTVEVSKSVLELIFCL